MNRLLQSAVLLALAQVPLSAQDTLASSVARAYGNGVTAAAVELPAGASLPCESEQLRIASATRISNDVAQITVQCPKATTLPVIAWVRSSKLPETSARAVRTIERKTQEPPLIKAGARATLELTQEGMLITLPVVALGPGRAGETIRVMDTTGRLRYRATVVSAVLLRAELP